MAAATASTVRCVGVWATTTATAAGLAAWLLGVLGGVRAVLTAPQPSFDRLLVVACAAAALVAVAWLWLLTTAVVVEALRGRPHLTPGVPASLRRVVLTACGVAVLAGLAVPAQASTGEPHGPAPQTAAVVIAGLPLPDRAVAARPGPEVVEVQPGDTLWALARRDLGPGADDAAIAARWHRIYALNRSVIGADPDLIRPAQRLRLPAR